MKYWLLVAAGLRRKPVRTILTAVAIAVAFLLFGVMHGVIAGFEHAASKMSDTRLRVLNRANIIEPLPLAHADRILGVDGVTALTHATIFGGYYQDLSGGISMAAVDLDTFPDVFSGILTVAPHQLAELKRTRTGAIVGSKLAEKFGWKVGQKVPMRSFIWSQADGSNTWTFDILAIAHPSSEEYEMFANEMYVHYTYLDESRVAAKGTTHQYIVAIAGAGQADRIAGEIDALFANSMFETTTMDEKQYLRAQLSQIGDVQLFVNYILGAVLFTLLFLTGTTLMQSMRERIREFGVLKSVGFTDSGVFALIVAEALVLCAAGAAAGLLIAGSVFPQIFATMGLAGAPLPNGVYVDGALIALGVSLLVAVWPAWRARRLTIAEAVGRAV